MRLLYLTMLLPGMRRTGAEVASQGFIDALRGLGHDTTVLAYRRVGTDPPREAGDVIVADRHIETDAAPLRAAAWMGRALVTGQPYTTTKFVSRAYRRAAAGREADVVILDHARMAWMEPADRPFVFIAHNVEHRLYAGLAAQGGVRAWAHRREAARIREVETGLARRAAQVWTLTREDAEALGPRARAFPIPSTSLGGPPPAPEFDVALLGGWHWKANGVGLRWFVEEVAPHLDGLDVHVGGAAAEPIVAGRHGLRVRGPVPDAVAFLQAGRVVAIPSITGGGVQIKTLDAIASGRPIVATPVAMRGIDDPPDTVRVAEDGEAFASALREAVARPVGDGETARAWARERAQRFRDQLAGALEELAS